MSNCKEDLYMSPTGQDCLQDTMGGHTSQKLATRFRRVSDDFSKKLLGYRIRSSTAPMCHSHECFPGPWLQKEPLIEDEVKIT